MAGVPALHNLHRPVAVVVAEYALGQCDAADRAGARLGDPHDEESLHDFRVAVRRLRTALKGYAEWLPLPKKHRKHLANVARSTNCARDAEVAAQWLAGERGALSELQRPGIDWIIEALNALKERDYAQHRHTLPVQWRQLTKRLHKDLAQSGPVDGKSDDFATVTATLVLETADHLERGLLTLEQHWDDELAHSIRIDGKRLRYLLEPMVEVIPAAAGAVKAMKRFQDDLGDFHDGAVLLEQLPKLALQAVRERAERLFHDAPVPSADEPRQGDPLPGMAATARRIQLRHEQLRAAIGARYLGDGRQRLLQTARDCAGQLVRTD